MTRCENHDCAENSLCGQCRADLRLGREMRVIIADHESQCVPMGSEVDRLRGIIWEIDKREKKALLERNEMWRRLRKYEPEAAIEAAKGDGE